MDELAAAYGLFGKVREREGSGSFVAVPHGHFRTKDGQWVAIACTTDKMFERLSEAMERPELASHLLYGEQRKRLAARDEVNAIVIEWVGALVRDEVMERCIDKEVPVGKLNSIADIFEDEHFRARGNLAAIEEEGVGKVVVPGVVPTLSETPGRIANLGPPLGNATYEVMRELLELDGGARSPSCASTRSFDGRPARRGGSRDDRPNSTPLPLAGIRVIDVATVIAAPYCAGILGEFGAEVLKVEHPIGGDACRRFGTPTSRGDTLTWLSRGAQQEVGDHRPAPQGRRRAVQAAGRRRPTSSARTSGRARWRSGASAGRCCARSTPG